MDKQTKLDQAKDFIDVGNTQEARQILGDLIQEEPENAEAWGMLFSVLENPHEKLDCLNQVLRIHPDDKSTRLKFRKYKAGKEYRDYHTQYRRKVLEKEFSVTWQEGIHEIFNALAGVIKVVYQVIHDFATGRWMH